MSIGSIFNKMVTRFILLLCLIGTAEAIPNLYSRITADGCGISNGSNSFIVGGTEVNPHYKWPWIGLLRRTGGFICGGSLVKSKNGIFYFVTAAHCLVGETANILSVTLGTHHRSEVVPEPSRISLQVKSFISHPNFDLNTFEYDIAVITIANSSLITESNFIRPICFASRDHVPNESCTVIGWGAMTEGGPESDTLQEVSKPILDDSKCITLLGSTHFKANSMLCSGYDEGGMDTCQHDSGGPFFCKRDGSWELVGVVSFGLNGCARPFSPGIYSDCWNLRDWVNSVIN